MSRLEAQLALQIRAAGLPAPVREYRALPPRRWRIDFAWPTLPHPLGVEIDGGVWTRGRHTRGAGYEADAEKANELTLAGWRLLRVSGGQVRSGAALRWIERALDPNSAQARAATLPPARSRGRRAIGDPGAS